MKTVHKYIAGCLFILGILASKKCICKGIDDRNIMQKKKFESFYNLTERWLTVYEEGKSLESILGERNIKTVAVYGLGKLGKHVVTQLKGSKVKVVYAIDRVVKGYWQDVEVMPLRGNIPNVDAIIITAINDVDAIERNLKKHTKCIVLSLEEILYEG